MAMVPYSWLEGDAINTEAWLKKSVEIEQSLSYTFGPPFIQKPTQELYGDWLMSQSRSNEAVSAFNGVLERAPNRTKVLKAIASINAEKEI